MREWATGIDWTTKLDKIKDLHPEVHAGTLAEGNGVSIIQHGQ